MRMEHDVVSMEICTKCLLLAHSFERELYLVMKITHLGRDPCPLGLMIWRRYMCLGLHSGVSGWRHYLRIFGFGGLPWLLFLEILGTRAAALDCVSNSYLVDLFDSSERSWRNRTKQKRLPLLLRARRLCSRLCAVFITAPWRTCFVKNRCVRHYSTYIKRNKIVIGN